ncbi:MAG: hypothetical protein JNK50_13515, partial [Bacteroidia bacterium]|nr:hypothetical protein [Bacteroidia bacterium]
MKKIYLLLFSIAAYFSFAQLPNCNNYYALSGTSIYQSSTGIPNTSTISPIVATGGSGLAIGPNFGFPAPNPTYWMVAGGTYWYHNGTIWVNTGHSPGVAAAVNPGGSLNFLYNIVGASGQVWRYNGTGPGTLLATIPALAGGGPYDLVGDDQDNFYYLRTQTPQALQVYNSLGVLTCSYAVTGIATSALGGGFAIVGNTVTANNGTGYYVGVISGTTVNFTLTPSTYPAPGDFGSCYLRTDFPATITAVPNASISCTNTMVTLTATAPASITPLTYTWSGPGIMTSVNNASVNVNAAGVYTCNLSSPGCPTRSTSVTFTVINAGSVITPTITSSGNLTCTSPAATLSVLPNTAPHTYTWSGPGVIGPNNLSTAIVNAAGVYTVIVRNPVTGCLGSGTISVTSSIAPLTISVSPANPVKCSTGPGVTLTASGGTNYTWTPSATLSSSVGTSVIANPTITTSYTITGVTGVCSGSAVVTVSVLPTPTVNASATPTSVCAGSPATLSATGATTYTWNPGGLTGAAVVVTPTVTTTFTVTGANGTCSNTRTITLVVNPSPTLTATASPTNICSGAGTTVTLTSTGAVSYTWNPGGATGATTTVSPSSTTVYTVTGANASGCRSTRTVTVQVTPTPTLTATSNPTAICAGSSATLTSTGATTYTWNPGALTGSSTVVSPTVTTTYTVTGANGACTSTRTVTLLVNPNPTLTASASPTAICSGNSTTLTASGAVTYTWMPGALTGATTVATPATTTIFTLTGTNASGCSRTATLTVSVTPTPTVNVTASPTAICVGSSATLSATGATSYTWNPGAITGTSIVVTPTTSTTYTVRGATGTCSSTRTITLIVNPNPTVTAVVSPTAICSGSSATLTGGGATTYTWMPGSLTGSNAVVSPTVTTTYTLTGANATGCRNTRTVTLVVNPNPTLTATASPTNICSGAGTTVTLTSTGAVSYTWNPGGATGATTTVSPSSTTVYTVTGANA